MVISFGFSGTFVLRRSFKQQLSLVWKMDGRQDRLHYVLIFLHCHSILQSLTDAHSSSTFNDPGDLIKSGEWGDIVNNKATCHDDTKMFYKTTEQSGKVDVLFNDSASFS